MPFNFNARIHKLSQLPDGFRKELDAFENLGFLTPGHGVGAVLR